MASGSTNNMGIASSTVRPSFFQGTLLEILFINALFLSVCYAKLRWNPKKDPQAKKEVHLILEAFFKYSIVFIAVSLGLKWYNPDMAKSFIGTGLYHAAYTLHSFVAFRDSPTPAPVTSKPLKNNPE